MASDISSWIKSAAPTSALDIPTELQRTNDFPSDRTTATIEPTYQQDSYEGVDWDRVRDFERLPPRQKRLKPLTSWIYRHGWRLYKPSDGLEYWICRLCHLAPKRPRNPVRFSYPCGKATSSAAHHLKEFHSIGPDGVISRTAPSTPSHGGAQSVLDSYCAAAAERNAAAEAFDYETFKGLLVRTFVVEQIPLVKVESQALKDLLIYCNPRCKAALPGRTTLKRYIASAYDQALPAVESELASANSKINLSFDLWTSPNRRLSLLGVVAHYLDKGFEPRALWLALPRMTGAHTAASLSTQLVTILDHYNLRERFGYAVTDNASENRACLDLLAQELGFDAASRHVRCIGHIINLVAHRVLFGSDVESFEHELGNVTAEVVELMTWRRKGPIGKLHNLIRYITHSSNRREAFDKLQEVAFESLVDGEGDALKPRPKQLIRDNLTRWNSWYDAAERAVELRQFIDEFIDDELAEYYQRLARYEARSKGPTVRDPPKAPSLLADKLSTEDWEVIVTYMTILKPFKQATMKLQGNVNAGTNAKGAIWQVLPVLGELLKGFEEARQRHRPAESQLARPLSPPPTQQSARPINTRRRLRDSVGRASASTTTAAVSSESDIATPASQLLTTDDFAQSQIGVDFTSLEHHFTANINAAWQKLDDYYTRTDDTPIYRVAVFLHPLLKWRWFERYWKTKPAWRANAREVIAELWEQYKPTTTNFNSVARPADDDDEWSYFDDTAVTDQMTLYEQEPYPYQMSQKDSPIPYWISKRSIWPELAQMALDVYSTPPMSDEPERVFSDTGNLLSPKRRTMTGEGVEQMTSLRRWDRSGIITLSQRLFNSAVATTRQDDDLFDEASSFSAGRYVIEDDRLTWL
jgi:hypothetical protein